MEVVNNIKNHVKRNKVVYISGGIILAGFTCIIVRGRHAGLIDRVQRGLQDHRVHAFSFNFLTKESGNITNIVNVLEREGRGHPGYIIKCIETLEEFQSQKLAAISEGVNEMLMSAHIRGKLQDINGKHFERVAAHYPNVV